MRAQPSHEWRDCTRLIRAYSADQIEAADIVRFLERPSGDWQGTYAAVLQFERELTAQPGAFDEQDLRRFVLHCFSTRRLPDCGALQEFLDGVNFIRQLWSLPADVSDVICTLDEIERKRASEPALDSESRLDWQHVRQVRHAWSRGQLGLPLEQAREFARWCILTGCEFREDTHHAYDARRCHRRKTAANGDPLDERGGPRLMSEFFPNEDRESLSNRLREAEVALTAWHIRWLLAKLREEPPARFRRPPHGVLRQAAVD